MQRKIIIVRQKYTSFGGAERFVNRVMHALMKQGVEVSVLTRQWQGESQFGVQILTPFYVGRWWRDWAFAKSVCRNLKSQSGVIVQSHERLSCCDIYRAGDGIHREWLKQRARISSAWMNRLTQLSPYHYYVKSAEARMFYSSRLKIVVCNSPMVQAELATYFDLPKAKVRVIRNGVNNELFHPKLRKMHRHTIFKQYELPNDALLILILGSGFERKGVSVMLNALAKTAENTYLMVVGKTRQPQKFVDQAEKLGIADRVRFTGAQTDPLPFYGAADIFALPALYDPAPNVILEAMATGLPVITSDKTGNWDLVTQNEAGFCCDALDVESITQFIEKLQDDELRAVMSGNARQAILPWTESRMADEYQMLYDEIL